MTASPPADPHDGRRETRVEVLIATLLGIAAILTAFATYKSELLGGESLSKYNDGISELTLASQQRVEGLQLLSSDQQTFIQYALLNLQDADLGAEFRQRFFTEQLEKGTVWWDGQPDEVASPFVEQNPEYEIEAFGTSDTLVDVSTASFAAAAKDNEDGDKFVLVTVFAAIALFLLGVASVNKELLVKRILISAASLALIGGLVQTAVVL